MPGWDPLSCLVEVFELEAKQRKTKAWEHYRFGCEDVKGVK